MKEFTREDLASTEVFEHVKAYLGIHLPEYELLYVVRFSNYPGDEHLYMAAAKLLDTSYGQYYAAWTCWNERTQTLNYGHYMLESEEKCMEVMREFYREKENIYAFEIVETLKRKFVVKAPDFETARERMEDAAFYTGEVSLGNDDHYETEVLVTNEFEDEPVPDGADTSMYDVLEG